MILQVKVIQAIHWDLLESKMNNFLQCINYKVNDSVDIKYIVEDLLYTAIITYFAETP